MSALFCAAACTERCDAIIVTATLRSIDVPSTDIDTTIHPWHWFPERLTVTRLLMLGVFLLSFVCVVTSFTRESYRRKHQREQGIHAVWH